MHPYILRLPEWLGAVPDWVPLIGGTQIGGRPLYAYGAMLALAFALGALFSYYTTERMVESRRNTNALFLSATIGAIIGARLLYFLASAPGQLSIRSFFRFEEGGLVAYGGFLGALALSAIVAIVRKAEWWTTGDAVAPCLALGTGIVRLGCFLFGCDFGRTTDAAWGLAFPHWSNPGVALWIPSGAPAFSQHFPGRLHSAAHVLSLSVEPTQILMSLKGFIGFAFLMILLPRRRFSGQVLLAFLAWYAAARFLIEFLRGDAIRGTQTLGLPLSTSQFLALAVLAAVVPLWAWRSRCHALPR
jgi:phosphatidylglycerol:prolipoprotein diacylglycerol transferase